LASYSHSQHEALGNVEEVVDPLKFERFGNSVISQCCAKESYWRPLLLLWGRTLEYVAITRERQNHLNRPLLVLLILPSLNGVPFAEPHSLRY